MLLSATVSGMPELSRLANCCVKVASSWSLGLRFWDIAARKVGGSRARQSVLRRLGRSPAAATRRPLAASTATGKSPSRSICSKAAERSAPSRTPSTTSPVRRRAL